MNMKFKGLFLLYITNVIILMLNDFAFYNNLFKLIYLWLRTTKKSELIVKDTFLK